MNVNGDMGSNITVLYEDDDVVVVNKPAGLVVHPDGKREEATLVDWIIERYPEVREVGEPLHISRGKPHGEDTSERFTSSIVERPGIVHRLDRETSGAIIIAKSATAHAALKEQFQKGEVGKEYRAFTYGKWSDSNGVIDKPIGRSPKDFRRRSAQPGARGELRAARTRYEVMQEGEEVSYIAFFPETGRTHQIRVHAKALHHPVVCDKLYAPKQECVLGFERLALHAYRVSFTTLAGERVEVEAPLPEEFKRAVASL